MTNKENKYRPSSRTIPEYGFSKSIIYNNITIFSTASLIFIWIMHVYLHEILVLGNPRNKLNMQTYSITNGKNILFKSIINPYSFFLDSHSQKISHMSFFDYLEGVLFNYNFNIQKWLHIPSIFVASSQLRF